MNTNEVLKLALEALENWVEYFPQNVDDIDKKAITSLREELSKPDFWEGYVPEPDKRQQALDKKAENARELGLDYEPAHQEPVAWQPLPCPFCGHIGLDFADGETYRWGVASCGGCGASCGDVRREYPDKGEWHTEAIAEWNRRSPAAQRTWVGLTDEEIEQSCVPLGAAMLSFTEVARAIQAKLKEKNT